MRLFQKVKDGGPDSHVWAYTLIELKDYFSIILLKFEDGSRDAYHNHAFNAWSWLLRGKLTEIILGDKRHYYYPSLKPIYTSHDTFHKVISNGVSWVITFRGPWREAWLEFSQGNLTQLTHGREVL